MCDLHGTPGHVHDALDELTFVKSRRSLLRRGAGLLAFAGAGQLGSLYVKGATTAAAATPSETEGPFWLDVATQRRDIRTDGTRTTAKLSDDGLYAVASYNIYLT